MTEYLVNRGSDKLQLINIIQLQHIQQSVYNNTSQLVTLTHLPSLTFITNWTIKRAKTITSLNFPLFLLFTFLFVLLKSRYC
mmetsp:Transcript_24528/g.4075  ORF Transcript_24528/g.4075 Transcript_24528/m.4075 type:complete len:82 (-) Transcript_24528:952-1197(-)